MLSTSYTAEVLQESRQSVLEGQLCDSKGTRWAKANKLQDAFGGKTPFLSLAARFCRGHLSWGLECVVVAGTGSEKTIPLALLLFAQPGIVTPGTR